MSTPPLLLPEVPSSVSLPSHNGDVTGQSATRVQHVESEQNEFGTIVNETAVFIISSTIATARGIEWETFEHLVPCPRVKFSE